MPILWSRCARQRRRGEKSRNTPDVMRHEECFAPWRRRSGRIGSTAPICAGRSKRAGLRRARSRHQQLPAPARPSVAAGISRHRRILAHHPARRGREPERAAVGRTPCCARSMRLKVCAGKIDRHKVSRMRMVATRGLPRGGERRRVPRPRQGQFRPRHRGADAGDRGAARGVRMRDARRS